MRQIRINLMKIIQPNKKKKNITDKEMVSKCARIMDTKSQLTFRKSFTK